MLNLNQEQLKKLLIKNGFRKSLNINELIVVLAKIIEFGNFVVSKLPKENIESEKIRLFIRETCTKEQFIDHCYNDKRIFIDSKDRELANKLSRELLEKDLDLKINLILVDVPEMPIFLLR